MAFTGLGMFFVFLALPKIDWDAFGDLNAFWMLIVMVASFAPLVLLLIWVSKKISSRKLWWSIGFTAWIGTFALALSGYHLP